MEGLNNQSGKEEMKTREELIEECLDLGIPVTGYEDQETLEMFLGNAEDDYSDEDDEEFDDDFDDEDGFDEEPSEDEEIFDEDFDFDEDEDDDLFEDDESSYN